MRLRLKPIEADWAFGGVMFALCAVLTILQYRWTGQIAAAEMSRLRANLDAQARAMARAFDAELRASCYQLAPEGGDFDEPEIESAVLARFKAWKASNPHPIFKRIAVCGWRRGIPMQFSLLDQTSGRLVHTNWPDQWPEFPPFRDQCGTLLDFPLFGGPPPGGPRRDGAIQDGGWRGRVAKGEEPGEPPRHGVILEARPIPGQPERPGWPPAHAVILELDTNYLQQVWLPELVSRYLNPASASIEQVLVRTVGRPAVVLYSLRTNWTLAGPADVSVPFNFLGKPQRDGPGPPPGGSHWLLMTWQRPGALEAIVAASRLRDLGVAGAINLILLATGIALIRYTRRSRQLAEQQMKFVANVSHELRTPLTVMRGAAHNLQRGLVSDPVQVNKYSSLIIEHCEHLTQMVEQVLALAGAQNGRSVVALRPVALREVLEQAVAATAHDTQAAGCQVQKEFAPALPPVMGDASALRRAIENLITNAAKHGGQGGWIGITAACRQEDGTSTVEIEVADRGPGIPVNEQQDIFRPFFRGATAQAKQTRGSGLGLSVAKEIIEAHGGKIFVQSANGQGAVFKVRLPVASGGQEE